MVWSIYVCVVLLAIAEYNEMIPGYLLTTPAFDVSEDAILLACKYMDCFAIPLIIQISYFGSNRRNMKKLISTFKFWNYCRKKTAVVSTDNSINPSTI
uniref:Serpentine receptor class gamma n=1 Tax=Caenorhabditis tropicalis TaxID=1561998 RepID=A0A1I7TH49_9PELO